VVATLGLIAWAVVLAVPVAVSRPHALAWLVLVASLHPLAAAVLSWRREALRRVLLLVGYPTTLALGVALAPRLTALETHPPTFRLLGVVAVLAFGAAASIGDPGPAPPGLVVKPLSVVAGDPELSRRSRWRMVLLVMGTVGALALAVVAPALGPDPSVAYGVEAGSSADVLAAIVGACLGAVVLAGFVGPATRLRRGPVRARRAQRVGLYLLVVAVGAFVLRTLAARS
jgi:hypothetical protein